MVADIFSIFCPRLPSQLFSTATALGSPEAAMIALVCLAVYCFIHLQGIYFDLLVDIIFIVTVIIIMLHYAILAYSIITEDFGSSEFASSNGRFECLENAITGITYRVDGETKLSPSSVGAHSSSLNSNIITPR